MDNKIGFKTITIMIIIISFIPIINLSTDNAQAGTVNVNLSPGWNLIGMPETMTASELASKSPFITSVVHRTSGSNGYYTSYIKSVGITDFTCDENEGIYIYATDSATITFSVNTTSIINRNNKVGGIEIIVASSESSSFVKRVADYVCDGTDDEVQINNAVYRLRTTGGTVLLSDGLFLLSSKILIDYGNVTLMGQGKSTVIKIKDMVTTNLSANASVGQRNLVVNSTDGFVAGADIWIGDITSNCATQGEMNTIYSITGNVINCTNNLKFTYTANSSEHFVQTKYGGIEVNNTNNVTICDLIINGNKENQSWVPMNKHEIGDPPGVLIFIQQNNVYVNNSADVDIHNVYSYNSSGWFSICYKDSRNGMIYDNKCINCDTHGIGVLEDSKNTNVMGNYIENVGQNRTPSGVYGLGHCIIVEDVSGSGEEVVTVQNNICIGGSKSASGLYFLGVDELVVVGNSFYGTPYGITGTANNSVIMGNNIYNDTISINTAGIRVGGRSVISGNSIRCYQIGIQTNIGAVRSVVNDNSIYGVSYRGIEVKSNNTTVNDNSIYSDGAPGILINCDANDMQVMGNYLEQGYIALQLQDTRNNIMISNNFFHGTSVYDIYNTATNTKIKIDGNYFSKNGVDGCIKLSASTSYVSITNNYFDVKRDFDISTSATYVTYYNNIYVGAPATNSYYLPGMSDTSKQLLDHSHDFDDFYGDFLDDRWNVDNSGGTDEVNFTVHSTGEAGGTITAQTNNVVGQWVELNLGRVHFKTDLGAIAVFIFKVNDVSECDIYIGFYKDDDEYAQAFIDSGDIKIIANDGGGEESWDISAPNMEDNTYITIMIELLDTEAMRIYVNGVYEDYTYANSVTTDLMTIRARFKAVSETNIIPTIDYIGWWQNRG